MSRLKPPTAIIEVYNERDILPWTVWHLRDQGCRVYVMDNWSTDGSYEILKSLGVWGWERWPAEPSPVHDLPAVLNRKADLAAGFGPCWIIHHDADEIRRTPWPALSLAEGFKRVEAEGYNAIDHRKYNFWAVDNGYLGDPETYFRFYLLEHLDYRLPHVQAWLNPPGVRVDLSSGAGHHVKFPGLSIHPDKWTLKHYPIRSQFQGQRKIFRERLPRYRPDLHAQDWHVQYDFASPGGSLLRDPSDLALWKEST